MLLCVCKRLLLYVVVSFTNLTRHNTIGVDGYTKAKYGSTFTPCPGYNVQILDDAHQQVPANTLGKLQYD